jgi:sugar (pentulose or hexulose) kinase
VTVPEIIETTALGAAFLALVGIGAYATLSDASEHIVNIRERFDPDPGVHSIYADAYARYRQTYFALLPVFEQAARQRL